MQTETKLPASTFDELLVAIKEMREAIWQYQEIGDKAELELAVKVANDAIDPDFDKN